MRSINWINQLIESKNLPSHRQAALMLGMSEPLMSQHRNGKLVTLDDKYAYKLEELLNLPHGKIVADQHAEREKNPEIRAMWQKLANVAAIVIIVISGQTLTSTKAQADIETRQEVANIENPRVGGSIPPRGTILK